MIEIHHGTWTHRQILPIVLDVDNSQGDATHVVRLSPPGKLAVEIVTDDGKKIDGSLSCSLSPAALNKHACSVALPVSSNQGAIETLPSGKYSVNLSALDFGYLLNPEKQDIEIKPGETTLIQLRAETLTLFSGNISQANAPEKHVAFNIIGSDQLTPDKIVIQGPKNYELIPENEITEEKWNSFQNKRQSFAFQGSFVLYNPEPGNYTIDIMATGYETLHQSFTIEKNVPIQQSDFRLRKIARD